MTQIITKDARILFFDIETAPSLGFVWGKWEQNVLDFEHNGYMLCFSYKWAGEKKIHTVALPDFPRYKKNRQDDTLLVKELWDILDMADIVVAHNGDNFDIPKANARFIANGFDFPPSPFKSVDTLKIARSKFSLDSNKLDDLGKYLKVGSKVPHTGFKLWKDCMEGDEKAWALMRKYNAKDVELLEAVYMKLRQWSTNHPNVNTKSEKINACPICGSVDLQKRGFHLNKVTKAQRYQCQECGSWSVGPTVKTKVTIR